MQRQDHVRGWGTRQSRREPATTPGSSPTTLLPAQPQHPHASLTHEDNKTSKHAAPHLPGSFRPGNGKIMINKPILHCILQPQPLSMRLPQGKAQGGNNSSVPSTCLFQGKLLQETREGTWRCFGRQQRSIAPAQALPRGRAAHGGSTGQSYAQRALRSAPLRARRRAG